MALIVKGLGPELKELRHKKGLSLREVDKLTGISYTYLNMIENGKRSVTPALLRNLANVYSVDYLDLYVLAGYLDLVEDAAERAKLNTNPDNILGVNNKQVLPLLGSVKAGYDYFAQQNWIGWISIDKKVSNPDEYYALRVAGDSMQPILYEDDIVIVHKQNDLESGQVGIILIDGEEATIKKVIKHDDCIELIAFNSYYPPKKLYKKDNFKIIGKVIEGRVSKIFE